MANKYNTGNPKLCALRIVDRAAFEEKVISAIQQAEGNLTAAAASLSITRRTLSNWVRASRALKAAVHDARDMEVEA